MFLIATLELFINIKKNLFNPTHMKKCVIVYLSQPRIKYIWYIKKFSFFSFLKILLWMIRNCIIILNSIKISLNYKIEIKKCRTILVKITIYTQSPEKLLIFIFWILKSKKINRNKANNILIIKSRPDNIANRLRIKI